jgi:hypothetical protein
MPRHRGRKNRAVDTRRPISAPGRAPCRNHNGPDEFFPQHKEERMTKRIDDTQPEALATFAAAARNKGVKPSDIGTQATKETAPQPGDLDAEEKDAADIIGGNATGDIERVDAAIKHHAKTDKRAG